VNEDQPLALHCGVTRKGLYIFTRSIVEVYVCLSVCLSVTPLSPIKTVQCKSLWATTRTVVLCGKI